MCKEMVKSGQWTPAVRRLDDARRRLGGSKKPRPDTIFEGFSLHPEICATLVAIVIVFCAIFLKLVEVVPKAILFGVYFMEVAGLVALSVRYQNITFGAAAVILALYAYFRRADIPPKSRGDAAVVAWIFRGEESRRRRGLEFRQGFAEMFRNTHPEGIVKFGSHTDKHVRPPHLRDLLVEGQRPEV